MQHVDCSAVKAQTHVIGIAVEERIKVAGVESATINQPECKGGLARILTTVDDDSSYYLIIVTQVGHKRLDEIALQFRKAFWRAILAIAVADLWLVIRKNRTIAFGDASKCRHITRVVLWLLSGRTGTGSE